MTNEDAYWRLVSGFLQTKENRNTRAGYARDLETLAVALAISPPVGRDGVAFGLEDDTEARTLATGLAGLPLGWWRHWRDALDGSLASRRRRVAGVRAFCRWWSTIYELPNPVADLRPPAGGAQRNRLEREVVALTHAETLAICETARQLTGPLGSRTRALIEVLYGCGLRASEAASVNISALQLEDPEDPFLLVTGKGGRQRTVSVPHEARLAIMEYMSVGRPELRARDRKPRAGGADSDALFLGVRGRRIGRADVWRLVKEVAATAGVSKDGRRVFPHALRHSCGTHLIQAGIDIRYVQAHLGHASPVTTEIYTHVTASHLREDFDRAHPRARRAS
jgi:site-specific recombinase XerD